MCHRLTQLNLFTDIKIQSNDGEEIRRHQVLVTRVFLLLLAITFSTLGVFICLNARHNAVTVSRPSMDTYSSLQNKYPQTLSCTCSQIAVPYARFLLIQATQHPVCSSALVSSKWIGSLFTVDTARMTPLDFRLTAAAFFRLLAVHCSVSAADVADARSAFLSKQLVSKQVISPRELAIQAEVLLRNFNENLAHGSTSTTVAELTMLAIRRSRVDSAVHTNAFVLSVHGSDVYRVVRNYYPVNENSTFSNVSIDFISNCAIDECLSAGSTSKLRLLWSLVYPRRTRPVSTAGLPRCDLSAH